jgi:hypothetical protein
MRGAIPPLPTTPSWRGAQLKHRDNFTFTFVSCNLCRSFVAHCMIRFHPFTEIFFCRFSLLLKLSNGVGGHP